jgi:hypothetical protein
VQLHDDDTAMRNLAFVALTDAGVEGLEVAKVFGITAPYVSRIRGEARRSGAEGLVKRRGRPPKLSARQVTTVRLWGASTGFRHRAVPRSRNGQALVCRSTRSSAIEGEMRWERRRRSHVAGIAGKVLRMSVATRKSALMAMSGPH